jgi:hypothetical protein
MQRAVNSCRLILAALFPRSGAPFVPLETVGDKECRFVPPAAFSSVMGHLDLYLDQQRELQLFFPNTFTPVAGLLLFRLKRHGFSNARVVKTANGLLLTAIR